MKVYFDDSLNPQKGRTHPYGPSDWAVYYDFKRHPGLIPNVLEDFKCWERYSAVGVFYELLAWLNGPDSMLESNDCAFRGPRENEDLRFLKSLWCSGRLMIFYRALRLNTMDEWTEPLRQALRHQLSQIDPRLEWGIVTISSAPVDYRELPGNAEERQGSEILLNFWAWGDSENEVMENLERVFRALLGCLKRVS